MRLRSRKSPALRISGSRRSNDSDSDEEQHRREPGPEPDHDADRAEQGHHPEDDDHRGVVGEAQERPGPERRGRCRREHTGRAVERQEIRDLRQGPECRDESEHDPHDGDGGRGFGSEPERVPPRPDAGRRPSSGGHRRGVELLVDERQGVGLSAGRQVRRCSPHQGHPDGFPPCCWSWLTTHSAYGRHSARPATGSDRDSSYFCHR